MKPEQELTRDSLGTRLKTLRLKLGLSQEQLLEKRYSKAYLSRVENDQLKPSDEFLEFVVTRLGTTTQALLAEVETIKTEKKKVSKEALVLELMNAHVALQGKNPAAARFFLNKIDPQQLPQDLLGRYYFISGEAGVKNREFETAILDLRQALTLFESNPMATPLEIERVRNWLGLAFYQQGKHQLAIEQHLKCFEGILTGKITDPVFRMQVTMNLANEYHFLGDQKQALAYYREALKLAEETENDIDRASIYWGMGLVYRSDNNLPLTKLYLHKSASLYQEKEELKQAATVYAVLGNVMTDRGEFREAEVVLDSATKLAERLGDIYAQHVAYTNLAFCLFSQEKLEVAEEMAEKGLQRARTLNDKLGTADSLAQLAEVKVARGLEDEGFKLFEEAAMLLESSDYNDNLRKIYFRYATVLEKAGRLQECVVVLRKAYLKQNQQRSV